MLKSLQPTIVKMALTVTAWATLISRLSNPEVSNNMLTAIYYRFPKVTKQKIESNYNSYYKFRHNLEGLYDALSQEQDSKSCPPRQPESFLSLTEMKELIRVENKYKYREVVSKSQIRFDPDYSILVYAIDNNIEIEDVPQFPRTLNRVNELIARIQLEQAPELDKRIVRAVLPGARRIFNNPVANIQDDFIAGPSKQQDPHYDCEICTESVPMRRTISCGQKHHFCHNCVKETYNAMCLGEIKVIHGCLRDDCSDKFDAEELGNVVSEKILGAIRFKKLQDKVKEQKMYACPYCPYIGSKNEDGTFQCYSRECARLSCISCFADHEGKTCHEYQKEVKRKREFTNKIDENLIRHCPNPICRLPCVREDGCSKITCSCGTHYCWNCSKDITATTYEHYCKHPYIRGDTICPQCNKCKLYATNADEDYAIAVAKAKV